MWKRRLTVAHRRPGPQGVFYLLLVALFFSLGAASQETVERRLAIIVHPNNPHDQISKNELARIFLKRQRSWSDGKRCAPIDQSGDSAIRKRFSGLVLGRSVNDMKRYWMQETMTGNAKPPISLDSSATVKKYVTKLEGGIGYIYEDEVDASIKVIRVRDVPQLAAPSDEAKEDQDPREADEEAKEAP